MMFLHTPLYLLFLACVVALYWRLPGSLPRRWLLIVSSYAFYSLFDFHFPLYLLGLSLILYMIGKKIPGNPRGRYLALAGVAVNLAILGFFKYQTEIFQGAGSLFPHLFATATPLNAFVFPLGISFYTFQGISYILELNRKRIQPASFTDLALYLCFFPKLVAGPIVQPVSFMGWTKTLPQKLDSSDRDQALKRIFRGFIKKVIIADTLASVADVAFRAAVMPNGAEFPPLLYWQGFYLFAIQIYADFSGYTDLAIGSALLFGFRLPENFRTPYFAVSIADFWNRWHMSLTQWFREYLFFPLSRWLMTKFHRRWPQLLQVTANLTVMTLIGWWHGATWTFIAWGLWHGVLLSIERLSGWKPNGRLQTFLSAALTFHLVGAGWVLFRSPSFSAAVTFLTGMLNFQQFHWLPGLVAPLICAGAAMGIIDSLETGTMQMPRWLQQWLQPVLVVAIVFLIASLAVLAMVRGADARPFIYGRF